MKKKMITALLASAMVLYYFCLYVNLFKDRFFVSLTSVSFVFHSRKRVQK